MDGKTKIHLFILFCVVSIIFLCFTKSSSAYSVYVNSTTDRGDINIGDGFCDTGYLNTEEDPECTLRAAIEELNLSPRSDIFFNIPESDPNCLSFVNNNQPDTYNPNTLEVNCLATNSDPDIRWWRISPEELYPDITCDMQIMADTQAGYKANTNEFPDFLNGQPVVEVICSGLDHCFKINHWGADVALNGFIMNSATETLILSTNSDLGGPFVKSCYLGTDISGTNIKGLTSYGVKGIDSPISIRGGYVSDERNLIVAHVSPIYIKNTISHDGNLQATGSIFGLLNNGEPVPSSSTIHAESDFCIDMHMLNNNIIAGGNIYGGIYIKSNVDTPIYGRVNVINNIIRDNKVGIYIDAPISASVIWGNSIYDNDCNGIVIKNNANLNCGYNNIYNNNGLGIDLGDDGVTLNDPGDIDSGPNNLMNFPVIEYISYKGGGEYYIEGDIDSLGETTIQLFESDNNSSGYGSGMKYIDETTSNSTWDITVTGLQQNLTFTSTALNSGSTSEFSLNKGIDIWLNTILPADITDSNNNGIFDIGDEIEYHVTIYNYGQSSINNMKYINPLPDGVDLLPDSINSNYGIITNYSPLTIEDLQVEGNDSISFSYSVRVSNDTNNKISNQFDLLYTYDKAQTLGTNILSDDPITEAPRDPTTLTLGTQLPTNDNEQDNDDLEQGFLLDTGENVYIYICLAFTIFQYFPIITKKL